MSSLPQHSSSGTSLKIGRRSLVGALGAGMLAPLTVGGTAQAAAPSPSRPGSNRRPVYIGTFGGGIVTGSYDAGGGLTATGALGEVTDPSFLAFAPAGGVLYSLDTVGPEGGVRALTVGADGALSTLGEAQSTGGTGVTHLSFHPGGSHLLSANYDSGSIAAHPVHPDGSLGARTSFVQHTGSGPDPDRQAGPHTHQILADPGGDFVHAVDLGTDRVYTYRLDEKSGVLQPVSEVASQPGAGPRHMVFHPGAAHAYMANELDSTVTVYAYDSRTGALTPGTSFPALPEGADPGERNYPAEVVLSADNRFLYLSNRGHDSIAWFAVREGGATLELVDTVPSQGTYPRHISLSPSGSLLFAANQNSGTVGAFTVDRNTGALTAVGSPLSAPSAVCVLPA